MRKDNLRQPTPARANMDEVNHGPRDAMEVLRERADGLEQWLKENAPEVVEQQNHLDADSTERAYWNYGYAAALRDVLKLLDRGNSRLN